MWMLSLEPCSGWKASTRIARTVLTLTVPYAVWCRHCFFGS